MNKNIRIIIIISLVLIGILIFLIINNYEKRVIANQKPSYETKYNILKNNKNYMKENKKRYISYMNKNKTLNYNDIITRVNIGLDQKFYENIKKVDIEKKELILTNKYLKLSENYIPNNLEEISSIYFINGNKNVRLLTSEARYNFERLSRDATREKYPVYGQSAYRSYERQEKIYTYSLKLYGKTKTDFEIARPGHSEHQTGLAIDVSSNKQGNMETFGSTPSYNWMINNSYKYGFILRYPKNKENIHGFIFEPWHFRYVGIETATKMHNDYSNLTFDEYYYKFIK